MTLHAHIYRKGCPIYGPLVLHIHGEAPVEYPDKVAALAAAERAGVRVV